MNPRWQKLTVTLFSETMLLAGLIVALRYQDVAGVFAAFAGGIGAVATGFVVANAREHSLADKGTK